MLSFICHFCASKDRLMILKSNIAALFASFFCQRSFSFFCLFNSFYTLLLCILLTQDVRLIVFHNCVLQSNNPHTIVVVTLDPPIRKGQTLYPHIVIQVLYCNIFRIGNIYRLFWLLGYRVCTL